MNHVVGGVGACLFGGGGERERTGYRTVQNKREKKRDIHARSRDTHAPREWPKIISKITKCLSRLPPGCGRACVLISEVGKIGGALLVCLFWGVGRVEGWEKRTGITEINDGCVRMNIGTTRAQLCNEAGRRDICRCASARDLPAGRSVCNVRSHNCKYSSLLKGREKGDGLENCPQTKL